MKRTYFLGLLLCIALLRANAQELVDAQHREIVFHSVNVIPMDQERSLENQDVLIKDGRIIALGESGTIDYTTGALVIEAKGKYLIPGLSEMHAHVPPGDDLAPMKEVLMLFATQGVTTIRGMLGHPRHLELRSKIQSGEIIGPHLYTSGPSLNGTSVTSVEIADRMVREQKEAGYDFLKLHPGLTLINFQAIVKTANEVHIPFAGHVSWDVGIWRAISAQYASIDHMDGFIEGLVPGIEQMKEQDAGFMGQFVAGKVNAKLLGKLYSELLSNKVAVVPTQSLAERWLSASRTTGELRKAPEMIYIDAQTLKSWVEAKDKLATNPLFNAATFNTFIKLRRKLIVECYRKGVMVLLGSDAPQVFNVPGFSIHHELQYMVDAGLTPYEALRTGTVNPAAFFKHANVGTIAIGKVSDLILLSGNPLLDIRQTQNIDGVLLGSRWLSKDYIADQLKKLEKH